MPPKKPKGRDDTAKTDKSKTDTAGKKKKKILAKGEGMGGTIGLPEKADKKCILPCVKSFVRPPACCPMEMCAIPICCTPTPACPVSSYPQSTTCCYMQ